MRKNKLFLSLLMVMLLSVGNVWADPAAAGTTLFSENFGSYSANNVPSGSVTTATGRVVYGGGSVTYTCTASGTKIYNENTGGGTAPEILVAKNGGTFVVAGIPSGGAKVITVSLTQNNQALSVAPTGTGYSGSVSGKPGAVGTRTFDITVADGADATFTLTFTGSGSSNVRVDDILVTVKTAGEGAAPVTPTCAKPTFDPEDGETFTDDIDVEIAAESGTTIYYTTDGEDPTTSSDVYTTALNFTETTTLKAIAVKEGSNNSAVATATYTKVEPFSGSILEIVKGDFTTTSYDSNNGDHEKSGITFTTNKVYQSASSIQFQKTNGLLYNKTDLGEIAKIEITTYTGKANNLVVYSGTTENPTSGAVTGSASGDVTTYTFASGNGYFAIKCNSTGASNVDPIKIYYVYTAPEVATPTISGETPFVTSTTITLACTTEGASVYYTTDGSNPSSGSTLYTEPFVLNAGATVKAIAILDSDQSSIASKEFEKVVSYTTLADIFTKATEVGNTATDIYVTFGGWKVSAKTSNNVFLTDGTNGAVIYGSGHGFNAGDVLTGTVACKVQLYKGFAELTALTGGTTGLTVTPGSVGDPVVKTWDQLSAVNTGALVQLENLTYDGSSLSDGVNTIPTYTTFYTATFEAGKSYNLSGVYQYYESAGQILPRSAADVEEIIETFTVTYNNNPDHGTLTIKKGDDVVTSGSAVNEGTVLTIETTPAEDYKLAGVTVNGSAYTETTLTLSEDVTIAATFEPNEAPVITSYVLSVLGDETDLKAGQHVGDKVNLPLTATTCSKVFRGWSVNASCADVPEYAPGAQYTLKADNKLYAVYATATPGAVTNYSIDFENNADTYTDWTLTNITSKQTDSGVNAHGGDYFGVTDGKATASLVTNAKIANPSSLTVYVSKKSTNTSASTWYAQVSEDGSNWTDVESVNGASMSKGAWVELSANLSSYSNVYVRVYYSGSTAVRCIDDLVLSSQGPTTYSEYSTECAPAPVTLVSVAISGTATELEYTEGDEFNPAGLAVTGTYSDESTAPITEGITWAFDPATLSTSDESVSVTATVSGITSAAFVVEDLVVNAAPVTTDNVVILAVYEEKYYAMSTTNQSNAFTAIAVEYNGTQVTVKSEAEKAAIQWTKTTSDDNTTFQDASGKYMKSADGTTMSLQDAVCNWVWDATGEYYKINNTSRTFFYQNGVGFKNFAISNFKKSGYSDKAQVIVIAPENIVITSKADPELAYDPTSVTLTVGQTFTPAVLNYAEGFDGLAAVTYASNNEAVATVTEAGVISLAGGTGTAVITASFAGNASYRSGAATYTITVNEAGDDLSGTWALVTDEEQLAAGKKVVIAFTGVENENLVAKTMGAQNSSNRAAVVSPVEYANGTYILTPADGTKVFTLVNAGDGKYAFQATNNNYLYASSNSSNQLKETDVYTSNDNAKWAISIADGGLATIDAQGSNSRKRMRYNPNNNSPLFACYATDATTGSLVTVYMLQEETPVEPDYTTVREELTIGKHYTICLKKQVTAAKGGTFWTIGKRTGYTVAYLEEAPLPLTAGEPFIFQATADKLEVVYEGEDASEPAIVPDNALRGTFEYMDAADLEAACTHMYMLHNNQICPVNHSVGANSLAAFRAYIDDDAMVDVSTAPQPAPGRQVKSVPMQGNVATGVDNMQSSAQATKMLIDGQLFIIYGEKMYNATGSLVK